MLDFIQGLRKPSCRSARNLLRLRKSFSEPLRPGGLHGRLPKSRAAQVTVLEFGETDLDMANEEQLSILKQDVDAWNRWREENHTTKVDLSGAMLNSLDLAAADFKDDRLARVD